MGDMLVVNFAALHAASGKIDGAIRTINEQLGQLERDAAPLVATWDGAARAAYEARQRQWRTAAEELAVMLTDIKRALDDSAIDYRDAEDRNRQLFE